jgi:ABC-type transport system involved in multi-copper enzyme maturation permease subunit
MIKEMRMLLWKDFRLSRLCLFAGIMFIIAPYMLILDPFIQWYDFYHAWGISTALSQLTIALLAGNIIVCERADRSAAFLAFQGVTRRQIIASKLIICTIAFILIYAITHMLSILLKWQHPCYMEDLREIQFFSFIIGFCFFGSCWLFSCLLPSPISAIIFGILTPFFVVCVLNAYDFYFHFAPQRYEYRMAELDIMVGLISLVAGTWYFLRSKEA